MNIGFDIDDTITNSSDVFVKYAKEYNQLRHIDYQIDTNEQNQSLAFGWNEDNKKEFLNLYLKKILTETIPNDDSVYVINELKRKGYKVFLITARNDTEIPNMYEFTRNWLLLNGINYDKLYVNCKNKLDVCLKNNIDIFVDDNYNTCKIINEESIIKVLLYSTRYNKPIKINFLRVENWKQILLFTVMQEEKRLMKKELKYVDVDKREDFPSEPEGLRFVYFYGGTKNYRGYLAPENMSRAEFMEQYPEYIPEQNIPVYENNGIILRADPKFPCPGFYILSLNKTYRAFDLIDDVTFLRFAFILKKTKEGMRKKLGINYAHLLSNEKSDPYVNVHFWLVPVNGISSPDLLDFDVKEYLNSFTPKENIEKILDYNKKLREYFEEINLVEQDNRLYEGLDNKEIIK